MPAIKFKKIKNLEIAADLAADILSRQLADNRRVLWLLSGGSAVPLAIAARNKLPDSQNLSVSLCDERYVPLKDIDSNWCQLVSQGFNFSGLKAFPVLQGENWAKTTEAFNSFLKTSMNEYDYTLALLGMGADGHTSGILPGSGLTESEDLAARFQGPDYKRITTTPRYLRTVDEAVVYAVGSSKHKAIDDLGQDIPLEVQPIQLIKSIKKVSFINDYKGDEL